MHDRIVEGGDSLGIEPADRCQHAVESRAKQVSALGKKMIQRRAAELESAVSVAHAERHSRRLGRHTQVAEQAREQRVRRVVEDHEPGVDRQRATGPGFLRGDGVGVSAGVNGLLEKREVKMPVQEMGAAEPGDASADDREFRHGTPGLRAACGAGFNFRGTAAANAEWATGPAR